MLSVLPRPGSSEKGAELASWSEDEIALLLASFYRSRALDQQLAALAQRGLIGWHVPTQGYEAHLYGCLGALRPADWFFGDARSVPAPLHRGLDLESWLRMVSGAPGAAQMGHSSGNELSAKAQNVVSTSSLLGTHLAQAAGVAHAMKLKGSDEVCLAWFGPGAAAAGDAHVGMNFAGVYKSPCIFYLCTSGSSAEDRSRSYAKSFASRATAYGIQGQCIDGSDVFAVHQAVSEAAVRARTGGGASIIEARTGGEDGCLDPLERLEAFVRSATAIDAEALARDTRRELDASFQRAVEVLSREPMPAAGQLFEQVFASPTPQLAEQRAALEKTLARFASGLVDEEPLL